MGDFVSLWPGRASEYAGQVDLLIYGFTVLIVLLAAPVFILIVVFAVRYRRGKPADRTEPRNRNVRAEVSWSALPFFLIIGFYAWATDLFFESTTIPDDALEINVVAKQWMWKFQHPGGQREIDELHVPAGQPVALTMASQDVIHSLYLPALRLKRDVLPGRYSRLWFVADRPGVYRLTCTEFCGTDHSVMGGRFVVMKPSDYAAWLETSGVDGSLAADGATLFRRLGCSGCHGASSTVHAPSLAGLYGSPVPLTSGGFVTADEQYIRDSIMQPSRAVAAGYPDIMPTFGNVLDEEQLLKLVAYIKSLADASQETRP